MKTITRFIAVFALALTLAGCQADIGIDIDVASDGSGKVAVVVELDKDIAGQYSDPETLFNTADLRRSGWVVSEPQKTPEGGLQVTAEHGFENAAQARRVLAQLGEPFSDMRFSQDRSPFISTTHFTGNVDLLGGLISVDNDKFPESLQPLLTDQAASSSFEKAVDIELKVTVPGASKTFRPEFGSSTPIDVEGTWVSRTAALIGLAAIFALLSLLLAVHIRRHPRRGGKHFQPAAH